MIKLRGQWFRRKVWGPDEPMIYSENKSTYLLHLFSGLYSLLFQNSLDTFKHSAQFQIPSDNFWNIWIRVTYQRRACLMCVDMFTILFILFIFLPIFHSELWNMSHQNYIFSKKINSLTKEEPVWCVLICLLSCLFCSYFHLTAVSWGAGTVGKVTWLWAEVITWPACWSTSLGLRGMGVPGGTATVMVVRGIRPPPWPTEATETLHKSSAVSTYTVCCSWCQSNLLKGID